MAKKKNKQQETYRSSRYVRHICTLQVNVATASGVDFQHLLPLYAVEGCAGQRGFNLRQTNEHCANSQSAIRNHRVAATFVVLLLISLL